MARNLFGFLAKNKPVQRFRKTNNIPGANWLSTRRKEGAVQIVLKYFNVEVDHQLTIYFILEFVFKFS